MFPSLSSQLLLILLLYSSISWGCVIRNDAQKFSASLMGLRPSRRGLDCSNMIIKKTIPKSYLKRCEFKEINLRGSSTLSWDYQGAITTLNAEVPEEGTGAGEGGLVVGAMAVRRGTSDLPSSRGAEEGNTPASFSSNLWSAVSIYFWMNPRWIQRIKQPHWSDPQRPTSRDQSRWRRVGTESGGHLRKSQHSGL